MRRVPGRVLAHPRKPSRGWPIPSSNRPTPPPRRWPGGMKFRNGTGMAQMIEADKRAYLGHFYDSPRYRRQVNFETHVLDLHREVEAGSTGGRRAT